MARRHTQCEIAGVTAREREKIIVCNVLKEREKTILESTENIRLVQLTLQRNT